jgi:hypothetical protein
MTKKCKTVFELEACYFQKRYNAKTERDLPLAYPFDLRNLRIGFFSSLDRAEAAVKKCVKYRKMCNMETLYCFFVIEYRIDEMVWINDMVTIRSYLPDGKPEESCLTSAVCGDDGSLEEFAGRKPDEVRFKKGDLVEVVEGRNCFLGIVAGTPLTEDEAREFKQRSKLGATPNYLDDLYCVLDFDGKYTSHCHPLCTHVFQPRLRIPKTLERGLQAAYRSHFDKEKYINVKK